MKNLWLLLLAVAGCSHTFEPELRPDPREAPYAVWWVELQEDSGLRSWRPTPQTYEVMGEGRILLSDGSSLYATGFWCFGYEGTMLCHGQVVDGRIYMAATLQGAEYERVWKHEALHILLDYDSQHCDDLWYTLEVEGVPLGLGLSCGSVERGEHNL